MPEFFSSDGPYYLQFLVIFLVILVLLMGIVLLFRRLAGRGLSMPARSTSRSRQPRLGIVDIYELDRQRQLILLRRDNVEHLLLVGGPNDVVVERNVIRGAGARLPGETLVRPEPASDMPSDHNGEATPAALGAPPFEMPLIVPQPMPGHQWTWKRPGDRKRRPTAAPRRCPVRARGLVGGPDFGRAGEVAHRHLTGRPHPASHAAAARRPASGRRFRTCAPHAACRASTPCRACARCRACAAAEAPEPQPIVPPSLMSSGPPRPLDPAALSDMARQLETALRRQSSAVTPPPGQNDPAPEAPAQPSTPAATPAPSTPAEPVIAVATVRPNPSFPISRANPMPQPSPEPAPPPQNPPDPVAAAMAAAPVPTPLPVAPLPPPAPEAKPAQPAGGTPFTVEEIETEFARLLGRPLDRKN